MPSFVDNQTVSGQHQYSYTYDYVGNRTTMLVTDGSGTKTHVYGYDNIYQLTDVNYPTGYDYLATDTTFNYDPLGNRTTVIDDGGTTTYTTNNLNQYTAVGDVNYLYDDNGNMTYDGANSYGYDAQNRLVTVTKAPDALAVACDNVDLVFTTGGDASWFAQTAVYWYDNDAAQSGPIGDNQESWLETTVEGTGTVRFYWKVSCDANDGFAFYVDDQYIMGRLGGADWQEYPHDITTSGPHTLKWRYSKGASGSSGSDCAWVDYVRWSGSVPDPNGWQTITYTYDPAGRRIAKAVDGATAVKYLYDGDNCIAEYDGSDNLLRKYIFGPGIDQPISMIDVEDSNATYYYHFDALGSVVALTNSSGSTVELYEYSVYGQVAASDANIPNRFMFTGREFDADTGLYYYRARYYNPEIGRFLQTDPIGYDDGMNWYAYCSNNSTNGVDPSGLKWEDPAVRILLYSSKEEYWFDYLCTDVSGDPFWDIAIDISEKGDYDSSIDYAIALFSGSGLSDRIKAEIPINEKTGLPMYDFDTQITIEGVWIYGHGNRYGDTLTWPYDEAFMAMFGAIGKGLDALESYGAMIHLRSCTACPEDAYLLMQAAASASGHAVTAPLGTLWVSPWSTFVDSHAGTVGYAPWACSEGFGIATLTQNSAGVISYPTNAYYGGPELWGQQVEREVLQYQWVGGADDGLMTATLVTGLYYNRSTGTCVW